MNEALIIKIKDFLTYDEHDILVELIKNKIIEDCDEGYFFSDLEDLI